MKEKVENKEETKKEREKKEESEKKVVNIISAQSLCICKYENGKR